MTFVFLDRRDQLECADELRRHGITFRTRMAIWLDTNSTIYGIRVRSPNAMVAAAIQSYGATHATDWAISVATSPKFFNRVRKNPALGAKWIELAREWECDIEAIQQSIVEQLGHYYTTDEITAWMSKHGLA